MTGRAAPPSPVPRPAPASPRRSLLRPVAVGAVLVAVLLGLATPAAAHSSLLRSTPQRGASLPTRPAEVRLVFDSEVAAAFSRVTLTTPTQASTRLAVRVRGNLLTATVPPRLPPATAGSWVLRYRVVATDGHPIGGVVRFEVRGAASTAPRESPPTTPPTTGAAQRAVARPAGSAPTGRGGPRPAAMAGIGALTAAAGLLGVLVGRRRRHQGPAR